MTSKELIDDLEKNWSYSIDGYYSGLQDEWINNTLIPFLEKNCKGNKDDK